MWAERGLAARFQCQETELQNALFADPSLAEAGLKKPCWETEPLTENTDWAAVEAVEAVVMRWGYTWTEKIAKTPLALWCCSSC